MVGKHILKVEPLNAILDAHYFVRAVHECVMAWMKSSLKERDSFADHSHQQSPSRFVSISKLSASRQCDLFWTGSA